MKAANVATTATNTSAKAAMDSQYFFPSESTALFLLCVHR